jgi:hypothetical protein
MAAVRSVGLVMVLAVGGCACLPGGGGGGPDPEPLTATVDDGGLPVDITFAGGGYLAVTVEITLTNHSGATLPAGVTANVTSPANTGVEGISGGTCSANTVDDGASCTVEVAISPDNSVPVGTTFPVQVTVGKGGFEAVAELQLHTI